MAIKIPVSIDVISANPIDTRLVLSKEEMASAIDVKMPEVYFTICSDDGNLYIYNKQNDLDPDIGKYRLVKSDVEEVILDNKSISKNAEGELEILGFDAINANNKWLHKNIDGSLEWIDLTISKPIVRSEAEPLDSTYIWETMEDALNYVVTSSTAYIGQIIYIQEKDKHYKITKEGLSELTNDQIVKLYDNLGDNTDGAITQKAISEMINAINENIKKLNERADTLDEQVSSLDGKVKNKIEASIDKDNELLQLIIGE